MNRKFVLPLALCLAMGVIDEADAQAQGYLVVQSCDSQAFGPLPYSIGTVRTATMDVWGNICGSVNSGNGGNAVIAGPRTSLGYAQVASFSAVTGLPSISGSIPSAATLAVIECTAAVNYRDDGVSPTSASGMPLPANSYLPLTETAAGMANFKMIPQTGSAVCNVTYYQ